MNKKQAMDAFKYWGNQIYTPLGKKNVKAEKMRAAWAKIIDSGDYKKLPPDALEADRIVSEQHEVKSVEFDYWGDLQLRFANLSPKERDKYLKDVEKRKKKLKKKVPEFKNFEFEGCKNCHPTIEQFEENPVIEQLDGIDPIVMDMKRFKGTKILRDMKRAREG